MKLYIHLPVSEGCEALMFQAMGGKGKLYEESCLAVSRVLYFFACYQKESCIFFQKLLILKFKYPSIERLNASTMS